MTGPRISTAASRKTALLRHPLILPLYLPSLLISIAQGLMMPVLPLYANSFDAPYFLVGLLLAGDGLGLLLGDLPAGAVMRRLERRQGMLIGISMVGLATLGLFWAPSLPVALLFRFTSGLGNSLYNVARHTFVADTITIATRGQSVALLGATFRMGRMLGPAAAGLLAGALGLRAPFLVVAAVCALAVLTIYLFNRSGDSGSQQDALIAESASAPPRLPVAPPVRFEPPLPVTPGLPVAPPVRFEPPLPVAPPLELAATEGEVARMLRTLREHALLLAAPGLGQFLMQMVRVGPGIVLPLYGSLVLHLDVTQIGLLFSIASLVDMALFYPTGLIMDRLGRKWAIVPSALIMALGLALVPLATSFEGLLLAAVLNGFGNGLGSGVMLTLGADLAPTKSRGEFLGLWGLIGDAGVSSGPLLVGAVTDLLALAPATWAIAASGLAAGAVFALLVPETLKKKAAVERVQTG